MTARDGSADDTALIARICAEGFGDDPVMRWVAPDDGARPEILRIAFGGMVGVYLDGESVMHLVEDACVAMWRPPGWHPPAEEEANTDGEPDPEAEPSPFPADVQERFRILSEEMRAAHPSEPHWYLNVLATLPDRQGQGLGARAMRPILDRCDAEGTPAYLESSNPRNMTLYRRCGFDDRGEIRLPDGPILYAMWREPS